MRRTRIAGLCAAVLVVTCAVASASAPAAEYGRCVAQKKGEYANGSCTSKSVKPRKGDFEWLPGPAANCIAQKKGEYTEAACLTKSARPHKGKFERESCYPNCDRYTSTSSQAVFETAIENITCSASTDEGEITGLKTSADLITFTGCTSESGKSCKGISPGPPGVVDTTMLESELMEPGAEFVEIYYRHHPDHIIIEINCEGEVYEFVGEVLGDEAVITPRSKWGSILTYN